MSATSESILLPDLRQTLCHTSLALGIALINIQNPDKGSLGPVPIYAVVIVAVAAFAAYSWRNFWRRWDAWRNLPGPLRNRITRTPLSLRNRAISHGLMAALAACLTALGYLGHLIAPVGDAFNRFFEAVVLSLDAITGILSVALAASALRDIAVFALSTRSKND